MIRAYGTWREVTTEDRHKRAINLEHVDAIGEDGTLSVVYFASGWRLKVHESPWELVVGPTRYTKADAAGCGQAHGGGV